MLWAALLQARLTQTKEQNKKLKWRARMFSVEVRMIQGEGRSGEFTASKQDFASPSKIPWFHPSLISSCTAQSKASDSAKRGEATFVILAKILMGTPWWSLATAPRQAWEVDIAASTLILTQTGEEESKKVGQHWYTQEVNKQEPGRAHWTFCEWHGWKMAGDKAAVVKGQVPITPDFLQDQCHVERDKPFLSGLTKNFWGIEDNT